MRISDWSSDVCSSDLGFEGATIVEDRGVFLIVAQHRHDDDLVRRDARRAAQPIVVAMRHDDAADHPGRGAPARRVARSEEHTSELQSLMRISYAVLCLKKNI